MTRDQQLQVIREACVAANPEISWSKKGCITLEDGSDYRPIRLADVLLAIGKTRHADRVFADATGVLVYIPRGGRDDSKVPYDLRNDDFTAQSDECILFLHDLLK